jgi:hypothetical protein
VQSTVMFTKKEEPLRGFPPREKLSRLLIAASSPPSPNADRRKTTPFLETGLPN